MKKLFVKMLTMYSRVRGGESPNASVNPTPPSTKPDALMVNSLRASVFELDRLGREAWLVVVKVRTEEVSAPAIASGDLTSKLIDWTMKTSLSNGFS